jgi:Ca2+-binding RTX toxin-like protein
MNNELFKAILAMDSYNRGYDEGIILPPSINPNNIGMAVVIKESDTQIGSTGRDASFYAVAYKDNSGETIISYRGTDNVGFWSDKGGDFWNGYGTGLGSPNSKQALLAIDFYKSVAGATDPRLANISLTGHSLGGGLAGYVGALYGKSGTLFDNMAFEKAASTAKEAAANPVSYAEIQSSLFDDPATKEVAYTSALADAYKLQSDIYGTSTPWATDIGLLQTYYVQGELLSKNRFFQTTPKIMLDLGTGVNLGLVDRHSISTLVIRMFINNSGTIDWKASTQYFISSLYDNHVALAAGAKSITGTDNTAGHYASILRTAIAYSAIDEGTTVFGDTGIRAMYDDASDLGKVLSLSDVSSTVKDNAAAISDIFVQFAGQLAMGKIVKLTASPALNGVLTLSEDKNTLAINFNKDLWSIGKTDAGATDVMVGKNELLASFTSLKTADLWAAMKWLWNDKFGDVIDRIEFTTHEIKLNSIISNRTTELNKVGMFVASGLDDKITGSINNDFIYGGNGNDLLIGAAGRDLLAGGSGNDTLIGGAGNDVLIGNDGIDTADYSKFIKPLIINLQADSKAGSFKGTVSDSINMDKLFSMENLISSSGKDTVNFSQSKVGMVVNSPDVVGSIAIKNVEKYIGSNYGDRIVGDNNGVEFHDGSGSDTIKGGTGDDTFIIGEGDDFIFSNGGNDSFNFSGAFGHDAVGSLTGFKDFVVDGYDLATTQWYTIGLFGGLYWHTADDFLKLYTDYHSLQIIDGNGNTLYLDHAVDNGIFNPSTSLFWIV